MNGRDVLGLAQTGTGKTAAFALPILESLLANKRRGPSVLILAPTRELAMQIHSEIESLGKFTRVRSTTVYGGVSMGRQIKTLRSRPDIIVACPGRLLDLYGQGYLDLSAIDTVVLDEADNMFDMGFLPDIRRILDAVPQERQTLLFSATMPKEIRHLADGILNEPVVVELNHSQPISTIEHELYPIHRDRKFELLEHMIGSDGFASAIVFMRTKRRALRIGQQLARAGHDAVALQGNMSQAQRDRAMRGFRDGKFNILVATDIAARGIDVAKISHVINFDMPDTPDAYTHRIGRTGRAEQSGKAYTFVTNEDFELVHTLERHLGTTIPRSQIEGFEGMEIPLAPVRKARSQRPGGGRQPRARAPQRARRPDAADAPRSSNGDSPRPANEAAPRRERPRYEGGSSQGDRSRPSRDGYRSRSDDRGPRRESVRSEGKPAYGDRNRSSRDGYRPRNDDGAPRRDRPRYEGERGSSDRGRPSRDGYRPRNEEGAPRRDRPRYEGERSFGDRGRPSRDGYRPRNDDGAPRRDRPRYEGERSFGDRGRPSRDGYRPRNEDGAPRRERPRFEGKSSFGDRRNESGPRRGYAPGAAGPKRDYADRKLRHDRPGSSLNDQERPDRDERGEGRPPRRKTGPGAPSKKGRFTGGPKARASRPRKRTR